MAAPAAALQRACKENKQKSRAHQNGAVLDLVHLLGSTQQFSAERNVVHRAEAVRLCSVTGPAVLCAAACPTHGSCSPDVTNLHTLQMSAIFNHVICTNLTSALYFSETITAFNIWVELAILHPVCDPHWELPASPAGSVPADCPYRPRCAVGRPDPHRYSCDVTGGFSSHSFQGSDGVTVLRGVPETRRLQSEGAGVGCASQRASPAPRLHGSLQLLGSGPCTQNLTAWLSSERVRVSRRLRGFQCRQRAPPHPGT